MIPLAKPSSAPSDAIQVTLHGDIAVIAPASEIEDMAENLVEQAAQAVLGPMRDRPPGGIIVDLTGVNYVGSVFLSFLLRCHTIVKMRGSEMVLAGVSPKTRELLRVTALDTL